MSYTPTVWNTGDVITKEKLNNIEQGIQNVTADISEEVSDWLSEHVNVTEGVNIDDTLSVSGSAADAKAVGDELVDLKSSVNELEAGSLSALDTDAGQVPVANGDGTWEWSNNFGLKTRPIFPIYRGDYLCKSDYHPGCVVKINGDYWTFDAPIESYAIANATDIGYIRHFDPINNVEVTSDKHTAPLGHANSAAYDPQAGIVYLAPMYTYTSGAAVSVKKLYKFDASDLSFLGEEDIPSVASCVTYDSIEDRLYYLDWNRHLYLYDRDSGTWNFYATLLTPLANTPLNITYNQDLAIYNGYYYKGASVGDVIWGKVKSGACEVIGTCTFASVDSSNKFKLGELEGMEFDADGHLSAVCFSDITSAMRDVFIIELPVGTAVTEAARFGWMTNGAVYTVTLSETNQTAFALDYKNIRSLAQLAARTFNDNIDRVVIPEGSAVIDDFRVEVNNTFQLVVNGNYTTQGIDVYSGIFSISTDIDHTNDNGVHIVFTGSDSPINIRRVGELRLLGNVNLWVEWTQKPGWSLNLVNVASTSTHITVRYRAYDRTTGAACYIGNAAMRTHSYTQGQGIIYMEPATVENSYVPNTYVSQAEYDAGFASYMINAFLSVTYINISTSAGLPAGSRVYFARCGRYPKKKMVTNVYGVGGTAAQLVIDTDRYVYLYSVNGTNSADTFSTTVTAATDSTNVVYNTDYLDGIPMLLDKAAYDNRAGTILGGTVENDDYAILGPFDMGASVQKTYTIKTVPKVSESLHAFIRIYDDLNAASKTNYSISTDGDTRTLSFTARYITITVLKSEVENFYMHNDTDDVYVCNGSNVA